MGGSRDSWESERVETTYIEARTVIDHQRRVNADIDNKAMYTIRVIVIFLGIVVAVYQIGGARIFNLYLLWAGSLVLVGSMAVGTLTYSFSNVYLDPNRRYLVELVEGSVQSDRWDEDLVRRMGDWIAWNHDDLRRNGQLLLVSQLLLILGIGLVALAVAL